LKRLDKLTQEEAKMATAEVLKITRGMDSNMKVMDNNVKVMDNNVKVMDNNVKVLIDGAQLDLSSHSGPYSKLPDGKEARGAMQQEKRSSNFNLPLFCLMLSHGHRKANATGPPQVVISPGSLDKSQYRAQSSLRGDC
jgi:hypothetical protein